MPFKMRSKMELKDRLLQLGKEEGLTQGEFARRIGATARGHSHYENGARVPLDIFVNNICKAFLVSKEWLLTGVGEKHDPNANKVDNELMIKEVAASTPMWLPASCLRKE
jgi:transcriptional regulator with XRE-family HTH domain